MTDTNNLPESVEDLGMCDPGCHQGSHTETCQGYEEFYQEGPAR